MDNKEKIEETIQKVEQEIEEEKKEMEQEKPAQTDEQIAFEEATVAGHKVKPWTIGKLLEINPCLENILKKLEDKGINITLDNVGEFIGQLYFAAFSDAIKIAAISVDVKEEELHDLDIAELIKLIFVIYKQNEDSIKNVLSLLQMTT